MSNFEVIVGNIGSVYSGTDETEARTHFDEYVEQSTDGYGRAGYEDVTLMIDGEPTVEHIGREPITCDSCQLLSINGVCCHETGCPNMGARWDSEDETWVKQRKCFECGYTVDKDDPCCSADEPFEEEDEEDSE